MGKAVFALALLSLGCTRPNASAITASPASSDPARASAAPAAVQICNADGVGLGECLGCPGGPALDLALSEAPPDLAVTFDFPPGTDLTGFDPFADLASTDLAAVSTDLAVTVPDLAQPGPLCPVVMLVLDTSGSMDTALPSSSTTHLQAAKSALSKIVDAYGARVPFGFMHYDALNACTDGIETLVEPMAGSAPSVKSGLAAVMVGGSTNTGNAMGVIAADPAMYDPLREGSFVVLVTDGTPNCELDDPQFSITAVDQAAKATQPIKTYVVGLDLFSSDTSTIDLLARAGQRPCTGGFCGGRAYYPASTQAQLDKALDLVLNDLVAGVPGCGGFGCFPSGAACTGGTSCCGTAGCKNLQTDAENCGQCGTSCGPGGTCAGGACNCGGVACPVGDKCCNGTCCSKVDLAPPADLLPPPDLNGPDLGSCVCNHKVCTFGCVAANCCFEDTIGSPALCTATPNLCACSGIACF